MANITLTRLTDDDREQFILDNQRAFKYGATEEFGERDNHFEEDGEIISRKTIENSIDHGIAYRIREDGRSVGGLVLKIDEETQHNELELLFVNPEAHSKGIGYAAWQEVERLYPETKVWETCTPRPGISTSMSTNAGSISSSSSTAITLIRMTRRPARRTTMRVRTSTECSVL